MSFLAGNGIELISDFLIGLFTTSISIYLLFKIKPKLVISDLIGTSKSYYGEEEFLFKIINMGKYPITNIKADLFYINKAEVDGGFIDEYTKIKLKTNEIMTLDGAHKDKVSDEYLFHFCTRDNIKEKMKNDEKLSLRIRIIATHSLSQFPKVFQMDFKNANCIKDGEFEYGISTKIKGK